MTANRIVNWMWTLKTFLPGLPGGAVETDLGARPLDRCQDTTRFPAMNRRPGD
jgi:hypothetical protein